LPAPDAKTYVDTDAILSPILALRAAANPKKAVR